MATTVTLGTRIQTARNGDPDARVVEVVEDGQVIDTYQLPDGAGPAAAAVTLAAAGWVVDSWEHVADPHGFPGAYVGTIRPR